MRTGSHLPPTGTTGLRVVCCWVECWFRYWLLKRCRELQVYIDGENDWQYGQPLHDWLQAKAVQSARRYAVVLAPRPPASPEPQAVG